MDNVYYWLRKIDSGNKDFVVLDWNVVEKVVKLNLWYM